MRCVLPLAPFYLIDLLLYLEGLEIVEFWLVRLEFGVELVLASFFLDNMIYSSRVIVSCDRRR